MGRPILSIAILYLIFFMVVLAVDVAPVQVGWRNTAVPILEELLKFGVWSLLSQNKIVNGNRHLRLFIAAGSFGLVESLFYWNLTLQLAFGAVPQGIYGSAQIGYGVFGVSILVFQRLIGHYLVSLPFLFDRRIGVLCVVPAIILHIASNQVVALLGQ